LLMDCFVHQSLSVPSANFRFETKSDYRVLVLIPTPAMHARGGWVRF
jgi:hypothetical protein